MVKIKTTADLVDKLNNEKISIRTISTSTPSKDGNILQNGVFTDYSGDGSLFTITSARNTGKKVYGETSVTKKEKDVWETIASWILPIPSVVTTYTYTWTETTPNSVGTTYRINAAQPIKIQTTNKADSSINITNEGNITVASDLGTGANGTVNLTSKYGKISTSDTGKITSDKINLTANNNIDVTLGLPENKTTELKATTDLESVKINANTKLSNLDISAAEDFGGKDVKIVGTDDISGKINAKTLNVTTPGNIDITTQVSDKLTAQGDKSVKVTQTEGDLKIGKIASKGNVTLTASNGAIVNAVDATFDMTGAANKIDAWTAAGLISGKDSDGSATNAAKEEKAVRLKGLENLFNRWALKDDGTIDEKLYNQFVNNTADKTNLTDEQISQLNLYQELKNSNDYGFSKNQLLYAVQESLLNPNAGVTANITDPIITGKNITLNAKSFGKELTPVTYTNLTNVNTLKKLAGAKGGDVTFNENGTVTLREQSPVTVRQLSTEDKLNVTTEGNTFISGTDTTKFNVDTQINAGDGKVVLMTGNGIDTTRDIIAKEIELYAGAGELNATLNAGRTEVTKTVTENIVTTTITYSEYGEKSIFDEYKNILGVSVKTTVGYGWMGLLPTITSTLTATYNVDDPRDLAATTVDKAIQAIKNNRYAFNYSRKDVSETRDVTKVFVEENDSVGKLTANALGNINIVADSNLPVKNVTSGSNVNIKAYGNIIPSDENSLVKAPNVNLTATNNIATESTPLTINADNTALKARYAYITGNHGRLNAASGTKVTDTDSSNGLLNTASVFNVTNLSTAQNKEYYKVALALSRSLALTNKNSDAYNAAAKAWLNGMGFSEAEEKQIINLSLEIASDKLSSSQLLNTGIADITSKYSDSNISAKSVA